MCHKPVRESYSSDEKTLVSQETLSIRKFKHLDNVYFLVYAGKKSLSTKSDFQFTRPNVQQHPEKRVIEEVICRRESVMITLDHVLCGFQLITNGIGLRDQNLSRLACRG